MLICLIAGLLVAPLGETMTLRWTHSIDKTLWEEDYRLEGNQLRLAAARIRGSGAGMEAPPEAMFREGAWHYTPPQTALPHVELRHSPYVPPYVACSRGVCRSVVEWLPGLPVEAIIDLVPCPP